MRRRENSLGSAHFLSFSFRVKSGVEEVLEAWAESGAVAMSTSWGELRPEDPGLSIQMKRVLSRVTHV